MKVLFVCDECEAYVGIDTSGRCSNCQSLRLLIVPVNPDEHTNDLTYEIDGRIKEADKP